MDIALITALMFFAAGGALFLVTLRKYNQLKDAKSEDILSTLTASFDGILLLNSRLDVTAADSKATSIFNKSSAELRGINLIDLFYGDSIDHFNLPDGIAGIEDKLAGKKFNTTISASGGEIPVSVVFSIRKSGKTHRLIAAMLKREESGSKKSEPGENSRYRTLADSTSQLIFSLDKDLAITSINKFAEQTLGVSSAELTGKLFTDVIDSTHADKAELQLNNQMEKLAPERYFEYSITTKEGKKLWLGQKNRLVISADDPAGFECIAYDIKSTKARENDEQKNNDKYRDVFDFSADAVFIIHEDKFADCNNKSVEMLQSGRNDIIGSSFLDFSPDRQPDGRRSSEKFREKEYEVIRGMAQNFEWLMKRKNGTTFHSEITLNKLDSFGEKFIQVIIRDISRRKHTEEELNNYRNYLEEMVAERTSELTAANNRLRQEIFEKEAIENELRENQELYSDLVDRSGIAIFADDKNGNFTYLNDKFCALFGYKCSELRDKAFLDLVHPDDKERIEKIYSGRFDATERSGHFEFRALKKDGTEMFVEAAMAPVHPDEEKGARCYLWDITGRKHAEQQMILSDQILQKAGTVVLVSDSAGEIIYASPYIKNVLGYEPDEVLYNGWWDLTHSKESADKEKRYIRKCAAGQIKLSEKPYERHVRTKDGSYRWILWQDALNGNTVIGVGQDITEQKRSEELIRRAKEEAEKANKLKSEFLANISHEIRTPMNGIIGFAEAMLSSEELKAVHALAQNILTESDSLLRLINQLLDHAKIEAGKTDLDLQDCDFHKFLENIAKNFYDQSKRKGLEFKFYYTEDVPHYIECDQLRLRQIILNLLSNALKFTEQGYIGFSIENKTPENDQTCELLFTVEDSGIGIPPEKQETIFQSFVQADGGTTRKFGGTGLGTTISKQLVELMGGRIGLESEPGKGSAFWFIIKFNKIVPEDSQLEEDFDENIRKILDDGSQRSSARILVVEDYIPNQEVAKVHLNSVGYDIDLASNGREAVEKCTADKYDLIFMDIQMPEMDGLTAAGNIRAGGTKCTDSVIIALTANADDETRMQCISAGMNGVITKPLRRKEFIATADKAIFISTEKENLANDLPNEDIVSQNGELPAETEDNRGIDALPMDIDTAMDEFGDMEIIERVMAQFIDNLEQQVPRIRAAMEDSDFETLRREFHSIKGGSATLEANRLASSARQLESFSKSENLQDIKNNFNIFINEIELLKDYYQNEFRINGEK